MKHQRFVWILFIALVFGLAACGGQAKEPTAPPAMPMEAPTAVSVPTTAPTVPTETVLPDPVTDDLPIHPADPTADMEPVAVAQAFYDWYLAYIGDRADGTFRNPLVDKVYQDSPFLTERFIAEIDEIIAGFDRGGFDPFLLAQDVPTDFSVMAGPTEETAVVTLQFGPDSAKSVLVTVDVAGWPNAIRSITEYDTPTAAQAELSRFADSEYGFAFGYPEGWLVRWPNAVDRQTRPRRPSSRPLTWRCWQERKRPLPALTILWIVAKWLPTMAFRPPASGTNPATAR